MEPITPREERFRHSGWRVRRHAVYRAMLRTRQSSGRIDAFANCGSAAFVAANQVTGALRLQANLCHDRACAPCQLARSRLIAANIRRLWAACTERPPGESGGHARTASLPAGACSLRCGHPARTGSPPSPARLSFVTLTIRHSHTALSDQLDRLFRHAAALRRRKWWQSKVVAGLQVCEVKLASRSGMWHPHLHLLVLGDDLETRDVRREWRAVTGDSFVVDARPADADSLVSYLTKYLTKPIASSVFADEARLDEWIVAMKGRRMYTTFGAWRGIDLTAPLPDQDHAELTPEAAKALADGKWVIIGRLDHLIVASLWDDEAKAIVRTLFAQGLIGDST